MTNPKSNWSRYLPLLIVLAYLAVWIAAALITEARPRVIYDYENCLEWAFKRVDAAQHLAAYDRVIARECPDGDRCAQATAQREIWTARYRALEERKCPD